MNYMIFISYAFNSFNTQHVIKTIDDDTSLDDEPAPNWNILKNHVNIDSVLNNTLDKMFVNDQTKGMETIKLPDAIYFKDCVRNISKSLSQRNEKFNHVRGQHYGYPGQIRLKNGIINSLGNYCCGAITYVYSQCLGITTEQYEWFWKCVCQNTDSGFFFQNGNNPLIRHNYVKVFKSRSTNDLLNRFSESIIQTGDLLIMYRSHQDDNNKWVSESFDGHQFLFIGGNEIFDSCCTNGNGGFRVRHPPVDWLENLLIIRWNV